MKINVRNLSFGYGGSPIFDHLNIDIDSDEEGGPLVILGPSGSGKTTLLKLLGGLLIPQEGEIRFSENEAAAQHPVSKIAFMFQEPRLLPWLTVLENVSLPLEDEMGREEARRRARYFLSLVSLEEKESAYPSELSGGQAQRVSMARAFAWPTPGLLMDEPFQSLDIPLRISLMDLTLSLLEKDVQAKEHSQKSRFLIEVSHDPREAVYLGGRIIVLGKQGRGIVFDRKLGSQERVYGAAVDLERELIDALR